MRGDLVGYHIARGIAKAEIAVIKLQGARGIHQAGVERGGVTEVGDLLFEAVDNSLEERERAAGNSFGGGQLGENTVAHAGGERRVDSTRHGPGGMDAFARQPFDDLLSKFTQRDTVAGAFGMLLDEAEHVAAGRIGIHAQQQVGSGKMEETERMRLHELGAVQKFPQHRGSFRDADGHDGVAGLHGGQQMADRADAANTRGNGGHLIEGTALGKFFKAADLGDMDLGAGHPPVVIQLDRYFGVAFDAGYRFDLECLHNTLGRLSKLQFSRQVGHPALQQFAQDEGDGGSGRRTSRDVQIHFDGVVQGHGMFQ